MLLNCGAEEDSWESLDCKKFKSVNPKRNQSWLFIGRTDTEAPILWPPDAKSWLIGKDPDAGKHWRQEENGMTEDEMVGWHYQLNGHEFEQALGDSEGQGNLACCSPWGPKGSDMSEQLNSNKGKLRSHKSHNMVKKKYLEKILNYFTTQLKSLCYYSWNEHIVVN